MTTIPLTRCAALAVLLMMSTTQFTAGFSPLPMVGRTPAASNRALFMSTEETKKASEEAVFVPLEPEVAKEETKDDNVDDDKTFEKVEALGRGSAKKKRGKRKGFTAKGKAPAAPKTALAPEEVFYEGPPAITETIAPTASILTVIGIIPAAAAWARQAWVRYKITSRRIRVNSGAGGKDMAEIVYPDIVELRTAKRLFGDGDLVAFLRDGAKFEMRNIPNFDETMEFILKQCDPKVVEEYRKGGEVTKQ